MAIEFFGEHAVIFLFGSRTDDKKHGGDIDLYIETDLKDIDKLLEAKYRFLGRLKQQIGDQRIDVALNYPSRQIPPAIWKVARQTGIEL